MCDIVAVRGRQAASEVVSRLVALEPGSTRSLAVAELGGDRALRAPRSIESASVLLRGEHAASGSRLAIGRAASPGRDPDTSSRSLADCEGGVMVVHCGIIDNAASLRTEFERTGHRFASADDGEVIPHAIEEALDSGEETFQAFQTAVQRLRGAWAVAALIARHNSIFIARFGSPLSVRGTVGRCVVATSPAATEGVRGPLRILEDGSIAELGTMWRWAGTPGRPPAPVHAADLGTLVTPSAAHEPGQRCGTLQHH